MAENVERNNDRIVFGIMTLIFNSVGVPFFMHGLPKKGVRNILISVLTCGIGGMILEIIGIVNGIKILCMSDEAYMAQRYPEEPAAAEAAPAEAAAEAAPAEEAAPAKENNDQ